MATYHNLKVCANTQTPSAPETWDLRKKKNIGHDKHLPHRLPLRLSLSLPASHLSPMSSIIHRDFGMKSAAIVSKLNGRISRCRWWCWSCRERWGGGEGGRLGGRLGGHCWPGPTRIKDNTRRNNLHERATPWRPLNVQIWGVTPQPTAPPPSSATRLPLVSPFNPNSLSTCAEFSTADIFATWAKWRTKSETGRIGGGRGEAGGGLGNSEQQFFPSKVD